MAAEPLAIPMRGADDQTSFQMLIKLVGQMGETSATLRSIDNGLTELRTNTTQQLATLQERMGRGEALNDVQNEKIKQLESECANLHREIAAIKLSHAEAMKDLQNEQKEDSRMRWMVRGGLAVLAFIAPAVWQYVIEPLLVR